MKDQIDLIMEYEQGSLGMEETINLFQDLLKSGLIWDLQGHYQRTCKHLIDEGLIYEN